ncbi:diuretic hormone receptor [Eurytemora carolleeae]|uniref:diuretic hormone receptor n=1 Tax=Eurytemora carolleeae TaxID=1294199 RepID=UPI000C774C56|nr:diuretic hormone receptor [Eurytemora carolleeae]|eukprot:XP_023322237.1 diuretic hormone receptor-like [Eurytemora affinis]
MNYDDINSSYIEYGDYGFVFEDSPGRVECETEERDWLESNQEKTGTFCPPYWDRISCWSPTEAGDTASLPCMAELNGLLYDTSNNASLECLEGGVWANKSDYSACKQLSSGEPPISSNAISIIYFCGHSLSLVALLIAFSICIYFKEMRCLRNKIHANLFLTYILANSCWILTAVMQDAHFHDVELSWCVSLVFLRYFHLATFFWMFVEGLYLFVQVIATFSVENANMKLRHYFLIGWGIPFVIVFLWAILTYRRSQYIYNISYNETQVEVPPGCPFIEKSSIEWVYIVPVFFLLATNTFFLVSIFYVVVTKLRSAGRGEQDHQNWKAAKALLVIIPLLGITYLITILGPTDTVSISFVIFEHLRAVLLSTQGFSVTLPYCFLNTEVKGIIKHNWSRWRTARSVENNYSRGPSARNSISLAGYYACDSNITHLSNSRRSSFFRMHSQYLSNPQHQSNETQLQGSTVILEKGGVGPNRIIPVIQEESDHERFPSTLISVTPPTPLTSPSASDAITSSNQIINGRREYQNGSSNSSPSETENLLSKKQESKPRVRINLESEKIAKDVNTIIIEPKPRSKSSSPTGSSKRGSSRSPRQERNRRRSSSKPGDMAGFSHPDLIIPILPSPT